MWTVVTSKCLLNIKQTYIQIYFHLNRLKLYLHQFGIPTCALNCELPVTSRCHIVEQFNAGMYDIIIASDEKSLDDPTNGQGAQPESKPKKVTSVICH